MIITKQFIMDMGVCGESLIWYEGIFGTGPHSYSHVYDMVANTSDIDEETRERWIKWSKSLQTNPDAIRYDGRFEISEYRAVGPDFEKTFATQEEASSALEEAKTAAYNVTVSNDNPLFQFSQTETREGGLTKPLSSLSSLEEGYFVVVHCAKESCVHTLSLEELQQFLETKTEEVKAAEASYWKVLGKLTDLDDGFFVWEEI